MFAGFNLRACRPRRHSASTRGVVACFEMRADRPLVTLLRVVCHGFAEAVLVGIPWHGLPYVKPWHTVVRNAG